MRPSGRKPRDAPSFTLRLSLLLYLGILFIMEYLRITVLHQKCVFILITEFFGAFLNFAQEKGPSLISPLSGLCPPRR